MSAYIVDRQHILYLVRAAMSHRLNPSHSHARWIWNRNREAGTYESGELMCNDYEHAAQVANMLWRENIKSVSHRYPHESSETLPGPINEQFVIEPTDIHCMWETFDPVQVLKALACYEYQSCEHPEWEDSEAFAFCKSLEKSAICVLPGYEEAEWGAPKTAAEKPMLAAADDIARLRSERNALRKAWLRLLEHFDRNNVPPPSYMGRAITEARAALAAWAFEKADA
jgi:hypothetical protein